jgi:hypothetical protein
MSVEILPQSDNVEPRYDMPVEEVRALSEEFIEQSATPEMLKQKFGCYIVSGKDPYSNLARCVEKEVFYETFNNTAELMDQEYGPYEEHSTFFVVMDHNNVQPVGVMRVIENSDKGLKSLVDLPHTQARSNEGRVLTAETVYDAYGIDPNKCIDIATLAILKEWRGGREGRIPSLLLYRSLYLTVLRDRSAFTHAVSIMDIKAKKGLDSMHMPFRPILESEPFSYLDDSGAQGSLSQAIIAENHTFYPTLDGFQQEYDERATELEETKEDLKRLELTEVTEQATSLVEAIEKQINKYRLLALGMRLLMDGEDDVTGANIDLLLAPEIIEGQLP